MSSLGETGFAETASLPGLLGPEGEGQIGPSRSEGLARLRRRWVPVTGKKQMESAVEKSWVIFADASGLGDQLVSQLQQEVPGAVSHAVEIIFRSTGRTHSTLRAEVPEDWKQLLRVLCR